MTDREWAITWIEAIKEKYIHGGDESYDDCRRRSIDMAIEALKQPEIVRCKDCIYKEENPSPYWKYWCNRLKCGCDADWFCADGERRTDDA